ncbi:hypothetical protein ABIC37_005143 [Priestia megaterium]|uniref:hypothetical protein n=1 Tax=Priestia megaterium TaxID=1404 RepID=UPI00046FB045|nr:hypothetical protein [Priestia megaterium]
MNFFEKISNNIGESLANTFGVASDLIPFGSVITNILSTRKFNRLKRRLDENELLLMDISYLVGRSKLAKEFIDEKIAPLVLTSLIEEHEDAKIVYLLNGFRNVFIDENISESMFYNYIDTLNSLRYADLKRLNYFAELDTPYDGDIYFLGSEYEVYLRSIDSKLSNLYLIDIMGRYGGLSGPRLENSLENVRLSPYGVNFLKFVNSDEDIKTYLDTKVQDY